MLSVLKRVLWADRGACAVVGRTLVAACVLALVVSHMGEMWNTSITSFGGLSAFAVVLIVGAYAWKCALDIIALKGGDGKEEPAKPVAPEPAEPVKENTDENHVVDVVGNGFALGWDVPRTDVELPFSCAVVDELNALDKKAEEFGVGLHKKWKADSHMLDKGFASNVTNKFGVAVPKGAAVSEEVGKTLYMLGSLYKSLHRIACCVDSRLRVLNAHRIQKADGSCCFVSSELSGIYGALNAIYDATVKRLNAVRAALKVFGAPEGIVARVALDAGFLDGNDAFKKAFVVMGAVLDAHPVPTEPVQVEEPEGEEEPEGDSEPEPAQVEERPVKVLPPHPKKRDFMQPRNNGKRQKGYRDFGSWAAEQEGNE